MKTSDAAPRSVARSADLLVAKFFTTLASAVSGSMAESSNALCPRKLAARPEHGTWRARSGSRRARVFLVEQKESGMIVPPAEQTKRLRTFFPITERESRQRHAAIRFALIFEVRSDVS